MMARSASSMHPSAFILFLLFRRFPNRQSPITALATPVDSCDHPLRYTNGRGAQCARVQEEEEADVQNFFLRNEPIFPTWRYRKRGFTAKNEPKRTQIRSTQSRGDRVVSAPFDCSTFGRSAAAPCSPIPPHTQFDLHSHPRYVPRPTWLNSHGWAGPPMPALCYWLRSNSKESR